VFIAARNLLCLGGHVCRTSVASLSHLCFQSASLRYLLKKSLPLLVQRTLFSPISAWETTEPHPAEDTCLARQLSRARLESNAFVPAAIDLLAKANEGKYTSLGFLAQTLWLDNVSYFSHIWMGQEKGAIRKQHNYEE
jgi:hypothetical protein